MRTPFIAVTGLPRAGSTLLCQLLAQHPDLHSEVHSSPLCNSLAAMRRQVSDDQFFLAQLDQDFERSYGHLKTAMQGFLRGWYADAAPRIAVDKNRAWLHFAEMLLALEPEARLVVCVRELGQIYGSIEAQHQRTILLDFIDHLADHDRFGRADMLFAKDKTIGAPLIGLHAMADLPEAVLRRIYVLRFEDLMARPQQVMKALYAWLEVADAPFDPDRLATTATRESDSHYRMKYLHRQHAALRPVERHAVSPRIVERIMSVYGWFYQAYYPDAMPLPPGSAR